MVVRVDLTEETDLPNTTEEQIQKPAIHTQIQLFIMLHILEEELMLEKE